MVSSHFGRDVLQLLFAGDNYLRLLAELLDYDAAGQLQPGNVFLSGLPWQVPNGCNLSGATVTWNIGQSASNCGSSNVNWQVGCQGYSDFGQNGCDGNDCAGTPQNQYTSSNCGSYGGGGGCGGWGYGGSGGCSLATPPRAAL